MKNPQQAQSIQDRLVTSIAQMILDGEVGPNDRLKLSVLARRFGASQMPIREALWKLEGNGLVENIPNRGAVVRRVDESFIRNVYEVRTAIESVLMDTAVKHATHADLERVRIAKLAFENAVNRTDARELASLDAAFHGSLHAIARNDVATSVLQSSLHLMRSLRIKVGFKQDRLQEIVREHDLIYQAVCRGDVSMAVHYSRLHSNGAMTGTLEAFQLLARGRK